MDVLKKAYPLTFLCEIMNINRSGYYMWLNRKGLITQYGKNRIELTNLLSAAHQKHPSFGYHRLANILRSETGWAFSDNLAHKCCKYAGIKSKARSGYIYINPGEEHIRFPNIVKGKWIASHPLELVVSDMTIIKYRGAPYEWTFFLDTFNNAFLTGHVSNKKGDRQPYFDCLADLKKLKKEQTALTVLHTDQGSVYSSYAFNEGLSDYNIERSMSRAGTPTDNPVIEAINGWVKDEIRCDFDIDAEKDINDFIKRFMLYFNTERPAYSLGYKTPKQYAIEHGYA